MLSDPIVLDILSSSDPRPRCRELLSQTDLWTATQPDNTNSGIQSTPPNRCKSDWTPCRLFGYCRPFRIGHTQLSSACRAIATECNSAIAYCRS